MPLISSLLLQGSLGLAAPQFLASNMIASRQVLEAQGSRYADLVASM